MKVYDVKDLMKALNKVIEIAHGIDSQTQQQFSRPEFMQYDFDVHREVTEKMNAVINHINEAKKELR